MASVIEGMISGNELARARRRRRVTEKYEKIPIELRSRYEEDGWIVSKFLKNSVKMAKPRPQDEVYEDAIWLLFASMGFTHLNKDRHLQVQYDATRQNLVRQIDVLAIDEEVAIVVECKTTDGAIRRGDFKKDIEAISGTRDGIRRAIEKDFPGRKCVFLFATKNFIVSDVDKDRMAGCNIVHLDEDGVKYFTELAYHLGTASRYQMLGGFLSGQRVKNIDNRIPAIQGKMGGYTYYSFSIEPEKLLKICYVLHRSEANSSMMPTYQRLIKRERLRQIRTFVNSGGFFPNSLLINIDTSGKAIQFDLSGLQVDESLSRIGVLHLPQKYKSAYIIDGQHRLYGYADSLYTNSNSIPVVAFVNLSREQQVKLFMEINENQKTVSKNLRNTLNADLLWESDSLAQQRQALRLSIAQELGESRASPLYGRVIIGENTPSAQCSITIDTIQSALKSSSFFSEYNAKNEIITDGTFDKGSNTSSKQAFYPYLLQCLCYLQEQLEGEWSRDESSSALLVSNNGTSALIRIFGDIIDHLIANSQVNPKRDKTEKLVHETTYYLDPLISYIQTIDVLTREDLRKSYGSGGKTRVWRTFQKAIRSERPDFSPDGLDKYLMDNEKRFNEESYRMIRDIELALKGDFKRKLESKFGENWASKALPRTVYDSVQKLRADKAYESEVGPETISLWDCLTIINYRDIAVYGNNWSTIFEKEYTRPGEEKISGGKTAKTEWLQKLSRIRNQNFHTYSVKHEEYLFLKGLNEWLVVRKTK